MENSKKPYDNEVLNYYLGDLYFGHISWSSFRKENLYAKSRQDKYKDSSIVNVVSITKKVYELDVWIKLMEEKIDILKESFIVNELCNRERLFTFNIDKKEEDIYLEALKSYSYRLWEKSDQAHWKKFNEMLNMKYSKEMKERLVERMNKRELKERNDKCSIECMIDNFLDNELGMEYTKFVDKGLANIPTSFNFEQKTFNSFVENQINKKLSKTEEEISLEKILYLQEENEEPFQKMYIENIKNGTYKFLATGDANWDYYIDSNQYVYSIAKEKGCLSSHFGDYNYYKFRNGIK